MFRYIFKRLCRAPVIAAGLLLFAAAVSYVLCGLHEANIQEQAHYDATWHAIPVPLTVTNLAGTQTDDLNAPYFVLDAFVPGNDCTPDLSSYIKDLKVKAHHYITDTGILGYKEMILVGINTLEADKALMAENGAQITWLPGYDESIFSGEETVCILPQSVYEQLDQTADHLTMQFQYRKATNAPVLNESAKELFVDMKVVGFFTGASAANIYCPYAVVETIYTELGEARVIDAVSGTLSDNSLLEKLRQDRDYWFAAPSATGAPTEWGARGYKYYPNALDIDDSMLINAAAILENSIAINRICAIAVLALSAAAGFFIGLLVIRSRKKEIALLRTMGTANHSIFISFALENLSCIAVGILLGGAAFRWQPAEQLQMFAVVYTTSLVISLFIFMNNNLMTTMKEDE